MKFTDPGQAGIQGAESGKRLGKIFNGLVIKPANREQLLLWALEFDIHSHFKWYHTSGFIRFSILRHIRQQKHTSYFKYIFFGWSAE